MTDHASSTTAAPHSPRGATPVLLTTGFALFVGVLAALVGAAFARRDVAVYVPTPPLGTPARSGAIDTVTMDAGDPERWRYFSFTRGVLPPGDTAAWDLAFRRFHVMTSGSIATDSVQPFDRLVEAPAGGYVATTFASDTVNPAVARWYRYSFVTHLLKPAPRVYVVRTNRGAFAKLEFLGYYCPGPAPGCVTFRYAQAREGRRFE
ncbi:MAG TPA: HmuY family protein [Gemmatimonadales bacterium]|nr:HmuY family protein [Gemmatimonadales bacterium]